MNAPVVVGIDGSEHSHLVITQAVGEARMRGAPLRVVICAAVHADVQAWGAGPGAHTLDAVDMELLRDTAMTIVDKVRLAGITDVRGIDVDVEAHAGSPVEYLLRLSEDAQLLVVGGRGKGMRSHGSLGSVTTAVTRHAKCPVLVVP